MKRWALVMVLLTVSVWAVGQTMPAYGGVSTSTGTAVIVAPPSQPLLVAPMAHLGTAAPVAGATNATLGNPAGAVNSTLANLPAPAPIFTVPEIATNPVPVVTITEPAGAAAPGTSGLTISGTINPGVPFNTGVGSQSGAYPVGAMAGNQVSLGQVAREWRAKMATEHALVYNNQDLQQLNQSGGVSVVGGVSGTAVSPGTPSNGAIAQPAPSAPAVAQPSGTQPATPGVATPVPPQSQSHPAQQAPPMSQMRSAPEATASARSHRVQELPRTGSVLPVMAVVGLLATVVGLMAK